MVGLSIWRSDAVVLFDWLMSTDLDTVPITHPAQKQALLDLLTASRSIPTSASARSPTSPPRRRRSLGTWAGRQRLSAASVAWR